MTFFRIKMNGSTFMTNVLLWWIACNNFTTMLLAMPRPSMARGSSEVVNNKFETGMTSEPSCEELKAMWRFSKRQSRAAEITNEIPTYRDPFSYNVWEPYYARSRSGGGLRAATRTKTRPVYGVMVHKPPSFRLQDVAERHRAFEEITKLYGIPQHFDLPRRGKPAFRLVGGGVHPSQIGMTPQSGSFQHLKELIRTERARELQEQRMAEEMAAKTATLKDMTSRNRDRNRQQNLRNSLSYMINKEEEPRDEQRESLATSRVSGGVLAFPNLLAPATRHERGEPGLIASHHGSSLQYYDKMPMMSHRSMYSISPYSDELDSEVML